MGRASFENAKVGRKTTNSTLISQVSGYPVKIGWLRIGMFATFLLDCLPHDRDAV
jgi:hypothetical protein